MATPTDKTSSDDNAPDPATSYERAKPEKEAGMGRLDNNDDAVPAESEDALEKTVGNRQKIRQINAEDENDEDQNHS